MTEMETDISAAPRLLRPAHARIVLRAALRGVIPGADSIRDVHIDRCWPGRRDSLRVEWSFAWGRNLRGKLYGLWSPGKSFVNDTIAAVDAAKAGTSLVNVRRALPQWNTLVFSPDRDESMPHLTACLDGAQILHSITSRLRDRLGSHDSSNYRALLLAFKPGRRATIRFEDTSSRATNRGRFVGKTFADDRGRKLLALHRGVADQLAEMSVPVSVPVPLGFAVAIKMALFDWVHSSGAAMARISPMDYAHVLAAVHRLDLAELPAFSLDDEVAIVRQWHDVLRRLRPADADFAEPMVDSLCEAASAVAPGPLCVIHRDFYDRQVLSDSRMLTLCDLDTLTRGPAMLDLGNLAAHETINALMAGRPARIDEALRPITQAYHSITGRIDERGAAFFFASSLLRVGGVHSLRTATRRFARPLWRRAAAVLQRLAAGGGAR